jgi:hypothetical protein
VMKISLVPPTLSAWKNSSTSPEDWTPPSRGSLKTNFDLAVWPLFNVVAAVLSDHEGNILVASSEKLPPYEASVGKAQAALLAAHLAISIGCPSHIIEGDS